MPGVAATTYVFKSRAEAAKFTGKILKAQQQARGEKVSRMSVGWAQLKSGFSRQVSFPDASTVSEFQALQSLEVDLTTMVDRELCTRKPSLFDVPADFRWKRGDAQNNSRHIVVRHWSTPAKANSSLHAALSMEDKLAGINDYATWSPVTTRYKDWSVSPNPFKRLFSPIKAKIESYIHQRTTLRLQRTTGKIKPYS